MPNYRPVLGVGEGEKRQDRRGRREAGTLGWFFKKTTLLRCTLGPRYSWGIDTRTHHRYQNPWIPEFLMQYGMVQLALCIQRVPASINLTN